MESVPTYKGIALLLRKYRLSIFTIPLWVTIQPWVFIESTTQFKIRTSSELRKNNLMRNQAGLEPTTLRL